MQELSQLTEAIQTGNRDSATSLTQSAIDRSVLPREILKAMTDGMDVVGVRFRDAEIFLPEVLIAARAMKESMARLEPLLVEAGVEPDLTALVGTVQGDLHDIGKNLVGMMWRGANFNVVDLGTNVSPDTFVTAAKEHNAQIVGLSALLTNTMCSMKQVVDAFVDAGMDDVGVIVGGAPVTDRFAAEIGAHGYASDAASAVPIARQLAKRWGSSVDFY
jgi:5-methyltetrahydrofolate--homocysteine methyltransferase